MKNAIRAILWFTAAVSVVGLATAFAAPTGPAEPATNNAMPAMSAKAPAVSALPVSVLPTAGALALEAPDIPICCQANCEGCRHGGGSCTVYDCVSCVCGCGVEGGENVVKCCCIKNGYQSCSTVTCSL